MASEYQPFPISNFRTGFNESLEPWLLPGDAYQSVVNAHLYRGVLERINGYTPFAYMTNRNSILLVVDPMNPNHFTVTLTRRPASSNFYAFSESSIGISVETMSYLSDATSDIINLQSSANPGVIAGTVTLSSLIVDLTFVNTPDTSAYNTPFFQWDAYASRNNAIMGIKQYFRNDGTQDVMVFDTRRMGLIEPILSSAIIRMQNVINYVAEVPHDYVIANIFTTAAMTTVYSSAGNLSLPLFTVPGQVKFQATDSGGTAIVGGDITDNGKGVLQGTGIDSTASFVDYATGDWVITFNPQPAVGVKYNAYAAVYGDIFTGDFTNFFTSCNYFFTAFFTNNVNRIYYYDGIAIRYLNTNLGPIVLLTSGGVPTNYSIVKCLHVAINQDRLLLISPSLYFTSTTVINQQSNIYWSVLQNPFSFLVSSMSGQLGAPTSEPIRCFAFINTDMIVRFASSERVFRYTGDFISPFRWDSTNVIWDCDGPYSDISYDTWYSSVGKPGIVGSDGVNVKRADEAIPDFTDPSTIALQIPVPYMSQTSIGQAYGERFDDIKEGWLCYNSSTQGESATQPSNNVLSFNYLDSTYSIYSFPLSCLGYGLIKNVPVWGNIQSEWMDVATTWGSYANELNSLVDLGGDQYDTVFALNTGNTLTLPGDSSQVLNPVLMSVVSKNLNPFIEQGQLARLGYIDLFVSADVDTVLRVQFYVNDNLYIDGSGNPQGWYQESIIKFNPTGAISPGAQQTKVWKRIYVGAIGQSHTVRFYQNELDFTSTFDQPIYIHAMVLYMKPAGRIFQ